MTAAVRTERARHFAARIACAADCRRRREAVEGLLAQGDITATEAADLLGCHRSTILRRCKALGIDPSKARADLLVRLAACASHFAPLFELTFKDRLRGYGGRAV
jgi:hypothetical protein